MDTIKLILENEGHIGMLFMALVAILILSRKIYVSEKDNKELNKVLIDVLKESNKSQEKIIDTYHSDLENVRSELTLVRNDIKSTDSKLDLLINKPQ